MEYTFGIATVAAITVIVFIIAEGVKATPINNKWLPLICGGCGIVLGIVSYLIGVPDYPAQDIITAAAVGGVSGLAATGVHQVVKQFTDK